MLTYNFSEKSGPVYKALYDFIRADIVDGKLSANEKMPSKRTLAKNLGLSVISIENAYNQLICEGYLYSIPKRGYFVSEIENLEQLKNISAKTESVQTLAPLEEPESESAIFDFSSNRIDSESFPFSIWAKILRENISLREKELLKVSPAGGVLELRVAIAIHLKSFRAMNVNPHQIIVGAGTEYLYGLLVKLLGTDKIYCIENPGYKKLLKIYQANGAKCISASMDENGLSVDKLKKTSAQIAHISPTHHFPTGICMPVTRRYEMLSWANQDQNRYIIEDDYDSEFRLKGKPIPALYSLDGFSKVIYMNTFSKSLASTIRISYMVLPEKLADLYYKKLGFYSCTVSTFEQFTLASFISQGYFEKHINRMRLYYGRKRAKVIEMIKSQFTDKQCQIIENDSGLHFILQLNTKRSDQEIKNALAAKNIKISSITDYEVADKIQNKHQFILNYSSIDTSKLKNALKVLADCL